MTIGKKTKKLSPAMERLVGDLGNQAIVGAQLNRLNKDKIDIQKTIENYGARMNMLQGAISSTINAIQDVDKNRSSDDIMQEAQIIVDKNMAEKRKQNIPPAK